MDEVPKIAPPARDGSFVDAIDLLKGLFFNFLGMLMRVGKILFLFVGAHYYGPTELGLYFLAWSAVDIASKFGLWGLDRSLVRDIARLNRDASPESRRQILSVMTFHIRLVLLLSLGASILVFWGSPLIARAIFDNTGLIQPLRILSLSIPFLVLATVCIASTKGLRMMQYETYIRQGMEPAVLLTATLILIPLGMGATALALAHLMASMAAAAAGVVVLLRKFKHLGWPPRPLLRSDKKEILRYTSPIALMDFLNLLVARTDIIMVGALVNPTAAGIYGIAIEIISLIKRIRQGFEPIFAPIVSELYHHRETHRLQRNYVLVTRWLMAGSFLPVIVLLIFPEQILSFFGIQPEPATTALQVLALAHGFFGAFSGAENLLVMTGRTLLNAVLGGLMLGVNVLIGWWLIPQLGITGAALGTFGAFFAVTIARIYFGYRKVGLLPFGTSLIWPLLTAVFTTALFLGIARWWAVHTVWEMAGAVSGMAALYLLIYFGGAKEPEERYAFNKVKQKLVRVIPFGPAAAVSKIRNHLPGEN